MAKFEEDEMEALLRLFKSLLNYLYGASFGGDFTEVDKRNKIERSANDRGHVARRDKELEPRQIGAA